MDLPYAAVAALAAAGRAADVPVALRTAGPPMDPTFAPIRTTGVASSHRDVPSTPLVGATPRTPFHDFTPFHPPLTLPDQDYGDLDQPFRGAALRGTEDVEVGVSRGTAAALLTLVHLAALLVVVALVLAAAQHVRRDPQRYAALFRTVVTRRRGA